MCLMWNGFFLFILICHSYVNQLIGIQVTQNTIFFREKLREKNRPSCIINSCLSNFLKYLLTSLFKEYSFKLQAFSKLCVYLMFYFVFSLELFFFQIVFLCGVRLSVNLFHNVLHTQWAKWNQTWNKASSERNLLK